jgi:membrane protein required for colicin V production
MRTSTRLRRSDCNDLLYDTTLGRCRNTDSLMNPFDVVVAAVTLVAVVMGFKTGLLRSLATILGYVVAAPLAIGITPRLTGAFPALATPDRTWIVLIGLFLVIGILVSAMLRSAASGFIHNVGPFDRVAGALLGAVRIFLVAVVIVLVFDRMIPPGREPPFLVGSHLRPYLSAAGQMGLRSLSPEVEQSIDQLKRDYGL